jgi:hypothetical protein
MRSLFLHACITASLCVAIAACANSPGGFNVSTLLSDAAQAASDVTAVTGVLAAPAPAATLTPASAAQVTK